MNYRNNLKKYLSIRNKIKTGDVIAFKGTDFGARAILIGTKSNYSHVGLAIRLKDVSFDRVFIVEAVPFGIVLQPLSFKAIYYPGNVWWVKLNIEDIANEEAIRKKMLVWSMKQLGKPYDVDLIKGIVKNIFLQAKLPKANQYEFICSELVATAYKKAGLIEKTNLTPKQIMELNCLSKPVRVV